jgi:hypothetical protein
VVVVAAQMLLEVKMANYPDPVDQAVEVTEAMAAQMVLVQQQQMALLEQLILAEVVVVVLELVNLATHLEVLVVLALLL